MCLDCSNGPDRFNKFLLIIIILYLSEYSLWLVVKVWINRQDLKTLQTAFSFEPFEYWSNELIDLPLLSYWFPMTNNLINKERNLTIR